MSKLFFQCDDCHRYFKSSIDLIVVTVARYRPGYENFWEEHKQAICQECFDERNRAAG